MAGRFETWAKAWRIGWNGPNGQSFLGAAAALLGDQAEQWGIYALRQGLPEYAEAANARQHCYERGIEPGPSLTDAQVARLAREAATIHRYHGTPLGLLYALFWADFVGAVVVQQNGRGFYHSGGIANPMSLDDPLDPIYGMTIVDLANNPAIPAEATGAPENPGGPRAAIPLNTVPWWTFDAGADPMDANGNQFASRFAVLFTDGNPLAVGGGAVDLGVAANIARIRRVINAWKPAKATCVEIIVASGLFVWGWSPTITWGSGVSWGDSGTVTHYSP